MRKEGNSYKFSQICFFNYVFANWTAKQDIDYQTLDKKLDFLRFDKVIEYVSAIKNDSKLLDYLDNKMNLAWDRLKAKENFSDLESAESEIMKCIGHDIIDVVKQGALETSFNNKHSEKEYDEKLDQVAPLDDQPIMEVKIVPHDVSPVVEFQEILSLYARAFRAAEHILNPIATRQHFKNGFNIT